MKSRLQLLLLAPLVIFAVALSGCDSAVGDRDGSFTIHLTDAPGDFVSAVVTIDRISLQGQGGATVLRDEPATADLLELQNEILTLVEDVPVSSGIYTQLRLLITGAYIEVEQEDGSTRIYASSPEYAAEHNVVADGPLQMPSFDASGLKVNLPGGGVSVDGDQHILLLDFNVSQSFGQQAGESGMWVMHPVIHASDFTLTGTAEITLELDDEATLPEGTALTDFEASIDKDGDVIQIPFEEVDGAVQASFFFLEPASYPVTIVAPDGISFTTDRPLPITLAVPTAGIAQETVVLLSVTED